MPCVGVAYGVAKDCFVYIKHRKRHVLDLPRNFENLEHQMNSLLTHWTVVNDEISRQSATIQINKNYTARYAELCQKWKDYQENIIHRYKKIVGLESGAKGAAENQSSHRELLAASEGGKNKCCACIFFKLARLDKDIVRLTAEVAKLEAKITLEHVTSPINPQIVVRQGAKELTGVPSHHDLLVDLQLCLYVTSYKRIAISGAPQVGKTNILKNLNNLLVRYPPGLKFDYVIWVTFPTDLPKPDDIINNIQEKILQRLNLSGQNRGGGKKEVISRALHKKSYLLLFDGFSSSIELEDIGISEEHEHGKVIIEVKDPDLRRNFEFHKEIQLEKLPHEDSRKLFDSIIADETLCKENSHLGDLIIKELGGLPGVIASIAGRLKSNKQVPYWKAMKQRLKADIWDNNLPGLAAVKLAFDAAYSKLEDNDRNCILYAALFPKEFPIPMDILVECWKAEGFLMCRAPTFSCARGDGVYVLNRLTELYLLEKCSENHVKMPINYRRVALETPNPGETNATSFARSGPEIDGHLKDEEWEMATRVSLMQSQLEKLPVSPKCEDILTLFLQLNPNLGIIEKPFFTSMKKLRVLDLHSTGIKLLPPSISNLKALRSLYLNNCCDLTELPRKIVELKELEVLDIRDTSIHRLPKEISSLVGLRCLRFSFAPGTWNPNPKQGSWLRIVRRPSYATKVRGVIFPPGTADQLSQLEEMTIVINDGSGEGIEDKIRREVGEFKNFKNIKLDLIRHSSPQSQDQGNLVQQNGGGIKLPDPSGAETPHEDPTKGIQSLRSDNESQRPSQSLNQGNLIQPNKEGISLLNPNPLHDPTTGIQSPRSVNERTTDGTKNASGDNIDNKEKEKCSAEIISATGSTFGASHGVDSGLCKRKSLRSSSGSSIVDNRDRGRASGEGRHERAVRRGGGISGGSNLLGLDGLLFTCEAPVTRGREKSYEISKGHLKPANRKGAPHQPTHRSAALTEPAAQRPNQNTNQTVAHEYTCPPTSPVCPHATQLCHLPTNQSMKSHSTQSSKSGASAQVIRRQTNFGDALFSQVPAVRGNPRQASQLGQVSSQISSNIMPGYNGPSASNLEYAAS